MIARARMEKNFPNASVLALQVQEILKQQRASPSLAESHAGA